MKISVLELTTDRKWRSATGLDQRRFEKLLVEFKKMYFEVYKQTFEERLLRETGNYYCINNEEELLLFTLLSLKSGLTLDLLGLMCGMDGSNVKKNQRIGLEILNKTYEHLGVAPKRNLLTVEEFDELFAEEEALIIDVTEQQVCRPCDGSYQKDYYSGKKKSHS